MSWREIAEYSPIATAAAAAAALVTAWVSIHAQRVIARRRAAIDLFLKAEMDAHLVKVYEKFNTAIQELKKARSLHEFANSDTYGELRAFLNVIELMAVGIHNKIFDQRICYDYWGDIVERGYRETKSVIDFVRTEPGCGETYSDLIQLHDRWTGRRWIWQCWRSRWWPLNL